MWGATDSKAIMRGTELCLGVYEYSTPSGAGHLLFVWNSRSMLRGPGFSGFSIEDEKGSWFFFSGVERCLGVYEHSTPPGAGHFLLVWNSRPMLRGPGFSGLSIEYKKGSTLSFLSEIMNRGSMGRRKNNKCTGYKAILLHQHGQRER